MDRLNVPGDVTTGISGVTFRATLTATSNPYLADRVPIDGYVRVWEFDLTGRPQPGKVTFRPDPLVDAPFPSPFVEVRDARFTFGHGQP